MNTICLLLPELIHLRKTSHVCSSVEDWFERAVEALIDDETEYMEGEWPEATEEEFNLLMAWARSKTAVAIQIRNAVFAKHFGK